MPSYEELNDNEKNQIKINAKRNLEYSMYTLEIDILLEKAKSNPDFEKISVMENEIVEKENQILALGNVL
jgi:hypothetical protein